MYVRHLLIAGASALLVAAIGCGSKETTSSSPTAPAATTFSLSGRVLGHLPSGSASVPIPGATVSVISGPDTGKSTTTDDSGNFSFTGLQESHVFVSVSAVNYFSSNAPVSQSSPPTVFLEPTGPSVVLTGRVTDASTSAPIPGATVSVNGRYSTTTDGSGNYSVTGYLLDQGVSSVVQAWASGYEFYARYLLGTFSQSFRLQRIERITAGDSRSVTIGPDDSLCDNNSQDPEEALPGSGFRCGTVRVITPVDGVMTVEAVSTPGGAHPPLVVQNDVSPCCSLHMDNPTSIRVTAGTEVVIWVGMPENASTSQTFTVVTSMARP